MSVCVRSSYFNQWIMKNVREINFFNSFIINKISELFLGDVFFLTGGTGLSILKSIINLLRSEMVLRYEAIS